MYILFFLRNNKLISFYIFYYFNSLMLDKKKWFYIFLIKNKNYRASFSTSQSNYLVPRYPNPIGFTPKIVEVQHRHLGIHFFHSSDSNDRNHFVSDKHRIAPRLFKIIGGSHQVRAHVTREGYLCQSTPSAFLFMSPIILTTRM